MYAQIHGSMKAFVFDNLPQGTFAYHEQVPEEIRIPSVYFPHLSTNDMNNTKDSFTLLYTMTVRFFYATSSEAMQIAEEIADKIRRSRTLYLRNEDGSESSDTVYFKRVTTAPSGVGSAQLTMIFEYQQAYVN
ncbi:hypothetical protein CN544_28645 [Bacillus toyonensis]|uniref:hypothetical protein n=1 Tax=Bacillus toyonensis TaxID=155322 RepID=UPI000BF0B731|nr:hypothetical protein [Bacillus toyonensis]PEN76822.1 hypothetical protein CN544_28645 [Bacillus toyonensis]PHD38260.1 hypothetical protein COF48_00435 [Bacillus toyonensis]